MTGQCEDRCNGWFSVSDLIIPNADIRIGMGKVEIVVLCGVNGKCRVILGWSEVDRSAALPSSNDTGAKEIGANPILCSLVGDECVKLCKSG